MQHFDMESKWLMCLLFRVTFFWHRGRSATIDDIKSLRSFLFLNYSSDIIPLQNQSERVTVNLSLLLEGITKVDEVNQVLELNVVLMLEWMDEFLQWDRNKYGDIDFIYPLFHQIWHPKLMVANSLGSREFVPGENHPLKISHNGHVLWNPASVLQTSCRLDMTWFPFDKQTCQIKLMSLQYPDSKLIMSASESEVQFVPHYKENGVWVVTDSELVLRNKGISVLVVSLTLTRQSLFLVLNIIVPIVIISFLNMAVFAVPSQSGEKLSFAITVFLSLSVFMTYMSGQMPQTSNPLSVLTIYLTFTLLTSAVTVLTTIWILHVHHTTTMPVPNWLECLANLISGNSKRSKVNTIGDWVRTENESPPLENHMTWTDVSTGLDYIFLRLFITVMTIATAAFIVKLVTANN